MLCTAQDAGWIYGVMQQFRDEDERTYGALLALVVVVDFD